MSQVEAEDEEPSLLGYTQLPHSITHHLRANCLEDLQPRETWPEQLEDPADFSQINEDDSRFLRENLHIEKDRLSVLLPKLDGRLDYEADLNDLEIKLIKEELPMLTRDYGVNVFDPEWGGLYLEHEFSSCENVDEEADRECLHSPGDFAKDIQLENLVIPEEFNSTNEETFTTALKKKRYRSFDEAKTVCHMRLPYNIRRDNNLPTGNRSASFHLPFRTCNSTVFPFNINFTAGKQLQDTFSQT